MVPSIVKDCPTPRTTPLRLIALVSLAAAAISVRGRLNSSEAANIPIIAGITATPSSSCGLPKVPRTTPLALIPIVPTNNPTTPMSRLRTIYPSLSVAMSVRPQRMITNISVGPRLSTMPVKG